MISLTAQYAIRAVMHIAKAGRWCTAVEIATTANIPRGYIAKVLNVLAHSGILLSQRGFNGGFQFNPEFRQLSIYEIVRAIDPKERFSSCQDCNLGDPSADCAANRLLAEIQGDIDTRLRGAKLIDLLGSCGEPPWPAET